MTDQHDQARRRRVRPGVVAPLTAGTLALVLLLPVAASSAATVGKWMTAPSERAPTPAPTPAPSPEPTPEPTPTPQPPPPPPAPATAEEQAFADRFPDQWNAVHDEAAPGTNHWAVLIGINEHLGGVGDNQVSRQDAELLRELLLARGWQDDHIVLITDTDATGTMIRTALRWLGDRTDGDATAILHYSGHSKKWYGQDHDGDGEITDEGLWPTDDDFLVDSEVVTLLDDVDARRFWVNIAACDAAGFNDPGLARDGRLLTFSSAEAEKSYEDPEHGYSVWGDHLLDGAFVEQLGDTNGDGYTSIQEAFPLAAANATERTSLQVPYGPQNAVMVDDLGEPFYLPVWR